MVPHMVSPTRGTRVRVPATLAGRFRGDRARVLVKLVDRFLLARF